MPSARRQRLLPRLAVGLCAGTLVLGTATGCETTQEKAAEHQAESERILEARAQRQAAKKSKAKKQDGKGDKASANGGKKQ